MSELINRLVMRQGPNPGMVLELSKGDLTIGRDLGNDIVINDVEISRKHARLVLQGERYRIEDLGSTNGTFVNGQRLITAHLLVRGDQVSLGENVILVYEVLPLNAAETQVSSAASMPLPPAAPGKSPTGTIRPQKKEPAAEGLAPAQYAGQVPPGPEYEPAIPQTMPTKKPINTWLLAGAGCLLVVVCFLIALLVLIDQPWNETGLYCTWPFDIVFRYFGYCP